MMSMKDTHNRVVKMINGNQIDVFQELIEKFLRDQPESFSAFHTMEEYIELMKQGSLFPWIYYLDDKPIGLVVLSRQYYSPSVQSIKIEFLSCKNLHLMVDVLPLLEEFCRQHGYAYIEAIAHPTIAKFGAKKHGFRVPSVYIRKAVSYDRRN